VDNEEIVKFWKSVTRVWMRI